MTLLVSLVHVWIPGEDPILKLIGSSAKCYVVIKRNEVNTHMQTCKQLNLNTFLLINFFLLLETINLRN